MRTDLGTVQAGQGVIATNITVKSPVGCANRPQPRSHVVIAFRPVQPGALDGMFISIDKPTRSIQTGGDQSGPLIITLGARFDTGQAGDVARRLRDLEHWTRAHRPVREAVWRWRNEDCDRGPHALCGSAGPASFAGFLRGDWLQCLGISQGTAAGPPTPPYRDNPGGRRSVRLRTPPQTGQSMRERNCSG